MKTFKLLILIAALTPALTFATGGMTPPEPGDLPPNVYAGDGEWRVRDGVTTYTETRADGQGFIHKNCEVQPAECAQIAEDSFNPPAGDPEGDPESPEGDPEGPAGEPPSGEKPKGGILSIFKKKD